MAIASYDADRAAAAHGAPPTPRDYWSVAEFKRRHGVPTLLPRGADAPIVPAALALAFELRPEEVAMLEAILSRARVALDDLAFTHARIERVTPSQLRVFVPALDECGAVYDQTMDEITTLLGPERGALFGGVMHPELARTLSNFGAERRTLSVTRQHFDERTAFAVYELRQVAPPATSPAATFAVLFESAPPSRHAFTENLWARRFMDKFLTLEPVPEKSIPGPK